MIDYIIVYSILFLFGSAIGSFLNVVIYRLPRNENVAIGRSHCPVCSTQIKGYDMIPVINYLLLNGKCRTCKSPISIRYPLVEFLTGILCIVLFYVRGLEIGTMFLFLYTALLIAISFIDWDTMTIPNELVIGILLVGIVYVGITQSFDLFSIIGGMFILSVPMFLLCCVIPGAFGGGDIKMMFASGILLGFTGSIAAGVISILTGGVYATYLMCSGKSKKGAHMPFGPFLCIGSYLSLLYGEQLIQWYMSLFS